MKHGVDKHTPWLLGPSEAGALFGSEQMIQDFRDAGWLTPVVCRKRLTLFDSIDLARCRSNLRTLGDERLQELVRAARKAKERKQK